MAEEKGRPFGLLLLLGVLILFCLLLLVLVLLVDRPGILPILGLLVPILLTSPCHSSHLEAIQGVTWLGMVSRKEIAKLNKLSQYLTAEHSPVPMPLDKGPCRRSFGTTASVPSR